MAFSLSLISVQSSPWSPWSSIWCNLLLQCVCWDPMNYGFMIRLFIESNESLLNIESNESLLNFIMHDFYSFVFLSDLSLWFGQRYWFIFSGRGALWWFNLAVLYVTCEMRWDFPEEERMMQYSRDKYFPQLRTKVINPVGESHKASWTTPAHTQKQILVPNGNKGVGNPLGGYLQGLNLVVVDR